MATTLSTPRLAYGQQPAKISDKPSLSQEPAIKPNSTKSTASSGLETETGKASWYGRGFDGKKTASGKIFKSDHPMAAHPNWPFGTRVKVTNIANSRSVEVQVVDRGPAKKLRKRGVIVDLSLGSAKILGFVDKGITDVKLEVIEWGDIK